MARLPTVKICNPEAPDEFIIINESDYDPERHALWGEAPPAPPQEDAPRSRPDETEELHGEIADAMRKVVATTGGLTAAGIPKVEAVEAVLGYDISAAERDTVWAAEFETE